MILVTKSDLERLRNFFLEN